MGTQPNVKEFARVEKITDQRFDDINSLKEKAARQPAQEVVFSTIHGITVRDDERAAREASDIQQGRQRELSGAEQKLKLFGEDSSALHRRLKAADIHPLAVLPRTVWDLIREKHGLFEFNFNPDNTVSADARDIDELCTKTLEADRKRAALKSTIIAWCIFLSCASLRFLLLPFNRESVIVDTMLITFGLITAGFITMLNAWNDPNGESRLSALEMAKISVDKFMADKDHRGRLLSLFPGRRTPTDGKLSLNVQFPNPPARVAEKILRLRKFGIEYSVTAEPAAVDFVPPLEDQLVSAIEKKVIAIAEEERRLAAEMLSRFPNDPIIHIEQGSAVAIIDQYGDLPFEMAAVEEAISKTDLFAGIAMK